MTVTFRESDHTYWLGDKQLPSVTTILKPLSNYASTPEFVLRAAAQRGTFVHEACQFDDEGDLDEASVADAGLLGYVNAWRAFRRDFEFEPELIEHRCYHKQYAYAGTLDRWGHGVITEGRKRKRKSILLDIKSGQEDPTHSVQTAAYAHALPDIDTDLCMTVYVRADGTYKAVEHRSHGDFSVFLAALTLFNWRKQHGIDKP